jgi:PKD repeat protein
MKLKFYQNFKNLGFGLSVVLATALPSQGFSQTLGEFNKCGNDIQKFAAEHPEFMEAYQAFEANWQEYQQNINLDNFERSASGKYIIPVVVHVLHIGGTENIASTQVKGQITALNTLFGMQAPGLSGLNSFPAFDTLVPKFNGADTVYTSGPGSILLNRFEFRLATKDPQGNCTDGIVRVYTEKADNAGDATKFKQTSYWDRSHYFNMWVIKSFPDNSLLGYAQFPFAFGGNFPLTSTDGVAIVHTSYGTTGTASGHTGATPTHEAGHWLGLFHIWGDAICGSDGIDDTPIHNDKNFSSASCFSLPKTATCYADTNTTDTVLNELNLQRRNDIGEQWMNFMDYTDDNCQWMFSELQYKKMNNTMETVAFRGSLSEPANVIATGTDDQAQANKCLASPIADLWSRDGSNNFIIKKLVCAGGDLTYRDGTFNLTNPGSVAATLAWDFPGGSPATSSAASPLIVYNTPGVYDASLTSTNPQGSSTKTRDEYVIVSSTTADESNIVYYDDFEYSTSLYEQGKWININQGVDPANGWEQTTQTGYLSSKCMVMRNAGNIIYEQDFLISASYDMTTITNDKLYFKYAGARSTASPFIPQNDQLQVYASTNCGETWAIRAIKVDGVNKGTYLAGDTLYSAGLFTGGFVPTSAAQWKTVEVDLNVSPYNNSTNLRVMLVWTSSGPYSNDFYVDQLNITNSTSIGIEENQAQTDYSVYPNPVTATSQVYFKLAEDANVTVDVVDVAGRVVKVIYSGDLNAGEQYYQINNADFNASGIYMVRLNVGGVISTKKIIIE